MATRIDQPLLYPLTYRDAIEILRVVKESAHCESLELEFGDMKISVKRAAGAGAGDVVRAASPQPPVPTTPAARPAIGTAPPMATRASLGAADAAHTSIIAPMLGVFFTAPSPNAPPFVQPGDTVAAGDTIGLIEVMKLFTPIVASVAGKIVRVLADNGALVEHGQPLIVIDPRH